MISALEKRFDALEAVIGELARRADERRKINERKVEIAENIIGLPYYCGEYSGVIERHSSDHTKVIAHVKHQKTGEECRWVLDADYALCHLLTLREFSSWEEYYQAYMIEFVSGYEKLLIDFGWSKDRIQKEMKRVCAQYRIPYKSYYA